MNRRPSSVVRRLLLALIAALLTGCAQQPAPTAPTPLPTRLVTTTPAPAGQSGGLPGMLPYVDEQGGYAVYYPDDWARVPGEQGSVRFVADPRLVAEPSPAASPMVIILPGKVADIEAASGKTMRNSKDLLNYVLEGLQADQNPSFGSTELFGSGSLVFAAAEGTYHDNDYNVDVKTWVAATVQGDRALIAVTGSPVDQWEGYQAALRRIVQTIRLL